MRVSAVSSLWLFGLCASLLACGSGPATQGPPPATAARTALPVVRSETLSGAERRLLEKGQAVHHERDLTPGDSRYLGTVSYQLVKAQPSTIIAAFSRPGALSELLPKTKRATLLDAQGPVQRVELVQGNAWVDADYTVYLKRQSNEEVRFWLDRSRPHDIDDAWGYFRVEPFDDERTLMTVAVAVDIGSGLVRMLFAGAVQRYIFSTPGLIKRYAERCEAERGSDEPAAVAALAPM
jgi:hypothetical protein